MNNEYVKEILDDCKNDLKNVKTVIGLLGNGNPAVIYLNNYAVIRACGTMEVAFKSIITDFCSKESKKQVKLFLNKKIRESSMNPSYDRICNTLKDFDDKWWTQFKNDIDAQDDKKSIFSSIESLVDARNTFSHGGNPNISISGTIEYFEYFRKAIVILDGVVA